MAAGKEIRTKISSIQSTQKITSAMEMVAASKCERRRTVCSWVNLMLAACVRYVGHIANAAPEYQHMYMQTREVKRVGYIVVSTDRGLCGGLNINLFKAADQVNEGVERAGCGIDLCLVGAKPCAFLTVMAVMWSRLS